MNRCLADSPAARRMLVHRGMDSERELCGMRAEERMHLLKALIRARAALDSGEPADLFIAQADAASRRWTALGDALRALQRLESG